MSEGVLTLECEECGNTTPERFMGHIDVSVYDGILVWQCLECGRVWPRFLENPETDTRTQASIRLSRSLELFRRPPDDEDMLGL